MLKCTTKCYDKLWHVSGCIVVDHKLGLLTRIVEVGGIIFEWQRSKVRMPLAFLDLVDNIFPGSIECWQTVRGSGSEWNIYPNLCMSGVSFALSLDLMGNSETFSDTHTFSSAASSSNCNFLLPGQPHTSWIFTPFDLLNQYCCQGEQCLVCLEIQWGDKVCFFRGIGWLVRKWLLWQWQLKPSY